MSNHLHILLQVIQSNDLPKFMQGLLQVYASYFRRKYHSTGFVFQNRIKYLKVLINALKIDKKIFTDIMRRV